MGQSMEQILAEQDDFKLCEGLAGRLAEHYGDGFDAAELPEADRTVLLVWYASNEIEDGGFGSLFEGSIKGDPAFTRTALAFQNIGANSAAQAIKQTLALFPASRPPLDPAIRIKLYQKKAPTQPTPMDKQFQAARDEIRQCLAQFIRRQAETFLNPNAGQVTATSKSPPSTAGGGDQVQAALAALPHWARVAFAGRCARLAQQLLADFEATAPDDYSRATHQAIELTEESAADGRAIEGWEEAAKRVHKHVEFSRPALTREADRALQLAARAAESAARCAGAAPVDSAGLGADAWRSAHTLATQERQVAIQAELKKEFNALVKAAQHGNWTDSTRIPLEIWNMI